MTDRILYVQFTDPAAYPPIEHSSRILADRGWRVVILGTSIFNDDKLQLPAHPLINVKYLSIFKRRNLTKFHYIAFLVWTLCWVLVWQPKRIYLSDPFALPLFLLARFLSRAVVVYHEHDAPNPDMDRSWFMRSVLSCRKTVGKHVELCVIPQQDRLVNFVKDTGRSKPTMCVWNCPSVNEIASRPSSQVEQFILYYHGSINAARLPFELVTAISRFKGAIKLRVAGYEAPGSIGHIADLTKVAARLGAPDIVEFLGTIPLRKDLLRNASSAHVGLSLMPRISHDTNLRQMAGASNKPFDFMARGLPLLVTDLPDWSAMFVEPGFARACNPTDPDSIETELRWFLSHPKERFAMADRCIEKIRETWNYEHLFADAVAFLEKN